MGRVRFDSIPRHFHEITKDTKDAKKTDGSFSCFRGFRVFRGQGVARFTEDQEIRRSSCCSGKRIGIWRAASAWQDGLSDDAPHGRKPNDSAAECRSAVTAETHKTASRRAAARSAAIASRRPSRARGPHAADLSHPAFAKLFLETEWVSQCSALLCRRRPRSPEQKPVWCFHVVGAFAGELLKARGCYICKQRYVLVDMFQQACKGTSTRDAIVWADRELKKIYAGGD